MKTLQRYLLNDFLTMFAVALLIVTFVLSVGAIFKIVDIIIRGVPWRPVVLILLASIPTSLRVSVPMSALVSCLLLFGRLSADGELVAMRACGVKLRHVSRSLLVVTLLLVAAALYLNHFVEPACHRVRRTTLSDLGTVSAMALLEEGRFHSFEGFTLYIGKRRGRRLEDVRIYDLREPGMKREIRARRGELLDPPSSTDLILDLEEVRIDPFSEESPGPGYTGRLKMAIGNVRGRNKYVPDEEDLGLDELLKRLRNMRESFPVLSEADLHTKRTQLVYEISMRTSLALAPLAFVLVGIPLGIRSHRKESSVGIAISLGVVFLFYLLMILAESVAKRPNWHPEIVIWCPTVLFLAAGLILMRRAN